MNKKLKVAILTIMMFLTVGCTKYFKDDNNMSQPQFTWENTQKKFFKNWITTITNH